jgi:putative PIN family toxin of toxin-antitoxin system
MKAEPQSRRVVIDTNVWLSAALSANGAPARVVRRVLAHGIPVFSEATFAELNTRIWKPKFAAT